MILRKSGLQSKENQAMVESNYMLSMIRRKSCYICMMENMFCYCQKYRTCCVTVRSTEHVVLLSEVQNMFCYCQKYRTCCVTVRSTEHVLLLSEVQNMLCYCQKYRTCCVTVRSTEHVVLLSEVQNMLCYCQKYRTCCVTVRSTEHVVLLSEIQTTGIFIVTLLLELVGRTEHHFTPTHWKVMSLL